MFQIEYPQGRCRINEQTINFNKVLFCILIIFVFIYLRNSLLTIRKIKKQLKLYIYSHLLYFNSPPDFFLNFIT